MTTRFNGFTRIELYELKQGLDASDIESNYVDKDTMDRLYKELEQGIASR